MSPLRTALLGALSAASLCTGSACLEIKVPDLPIGDLTKAAEAERIRWDALATKHQPAVLADLKVLAADPMLRDPADLGEDAGPLLARRLALRGDLSPELRRAFMQHYGRSSAETTDGPQLPEALQPYGQWRTLKSGVMPVVVGEKAERPLEQLSLPLSEPTLDPAALTRVIVAYVEAHTGPQRAQACAAARHALGLMARSHDALVVLNGLQGVDAVRELDCTDLPSEDTTLRARRAIFVLFTAYSPWTPKARRAELLEAAGSSRTCLAATQQTAVLINVWPLMREFEPDLAAELVAALQACDARPLLTLLEALDTPPPGFFENMLELIGEDRAEDTSVLARWFGRRMGHEVTATPEGRRALLQTMVNVSKPDAYRRYEEAPAR